VNRSARTRVSPHELLLRAGRDLLREVAGGEEPAVVFERAIERIRSAGEYRSVRFQPGDDQQPDMLSDDPSAVVIVVGVNDRQHGVLVVEADPNRPPDEVERLLLEECADDLALALHLERLEQVRRQTLVRILESEERFRQVFNQTNDAILLYEVDPNGRDHRCLEANQQACRWLGYSRDELRRYAPADLIELYEADGLPPWDRQEQGLFRFEACIRRRGSPTTAVVSLHRFNLLGREVMLVVARDVAEERQREREQVESLRQIQQNMEQFQILNDQIRNPVQVIIGLADMEGGDVGDQIIRQAHEIDEIVRQLDTGWLESAKVSAYLRRYEN
jgi:PAS domain S-box-containing protein